MRAAASILLLAQAAVAAPEVHEELLVALHRRDIDGALRILGSEVATPGYVEDQRAAHELFRAIDALLQDTARDAQPGCRRLVEAGLGIGRAAVAKETTDLDRHEILAESLTLKGALAFALREDAALETWVEGALHLERFCDRHASRSKAILRGVEMLLRGNAWDAARGLVERAEEAMPQALGVLLARAAFDTEQARRLVRTGEPAKGAPLLAAALGFGDLARTPEADLDVATVYNDAVAVARSDRRTRLEPDFVMRKYVTLPFLVAAPLSRRWTHWREPPSNLASFEQWDTLGNSVRFLYVNGAGGGSVKGAALAGEETLRRLFSTYERRGKMLKGALNRHIRAAQVLSFVGLTRTGLLSRVRLYYFRVRSGHFYEVFVIEPGDSPREMDPEARAVLDAIREPEK